MLSKVSKDFAYQSISKLLADVNMAEIPVGEYLFRRLKQMGIETAFGVPGGKTRYAL
jgi:hypothetical protein